MALCLSLSVLTLFPLLFRRLSLLIPLDARHVPSRQMEITNGYIYHIYSILLSINQAFVILFFRRFSHIDFKICIQHFSSLFAAGACSPWTGRGGRTAAGALSNRGDRGAEARRGMREVGAGMTQESPGTTLGTGLFGMNSARKMFRVQRPASA